MAYCFKIFLFSLSFAAPLLTAHGQSKPNIVFIFTDDLGYTDLSSYGNPYHKTPRIDAIGKEGVRFTQAYSSSPVCSPSRAGLMTGKHPARLQLTNFLVGLRTDSLSPVLPAPYVHYLRSSEKTLADYLNEEGYTNGIVGKWHLGSGDSLSPTQRGFHYDRLIHKNGLDYYNYSITSKGKTVFEDFGTHYLTDRLTDYGVEFIRDNKSKPFFLYLAYTAPHVFIVPKPDKVRPYFLTYNEHNGKFNPYYAAMLESLDEGVGRILNTLKELGLDDNTLVVFTSDNGGVGLDELGPIPTNLEPLRAWKGHVYEGGIRVPTLIKWPGRLPKGMVSENIFTNTDYLPTLLAAVGSKRIPETPDGKNVLSAWTQPQQTFDRGPIYWHYPHFSNQMGRPAGAIRLANYKLIESYETGTTELYDLATDVSESNNLVGQKPEITAQLHRLLKDWQRETNANMPPPNPAYKAK
jgi:arylsulfatase A